MSGKIGGSAVTVVEYTTVGKEANWVLAMFVGKNALELNRAVEAVVRREWVGSEALLADSFEDGTYDNWLDAFEDTLSYYTDLYSKKTWTTIKHQSIGNFDNIHLLR